MVLIGTRLRPSLALPFLFVLVCAIGYRDADIIHTAIAADATESQSFPASALPLPNEIDSVKFGVIGDFGTGDRAQYQLAEQMASLRQRFKYDFVVTVGDNLYGSEEPEDFREKFELPYKPLLDSGVKFYASLGNHDSREQRFYELFNMGGRVYLAFMVAEITGNRMYFSVISRRGAIVDSGVLMPRQRTSLTHITTL